MPKVLIYGGLILLVLALVPPAIIARMRAVNTAHRRIHLIQDMDNQAKLRAQQASELFLDGRAMRRPVAGTVARGELDEDEHFVLGVVNNQWADAFPAKVPLDRALMERGRERFTIYCQPCHGASGYGDGIIHQRATQLMISGIQETTWVQPKSLHEEAIRTQPVGQIYNTVTNGIRTMAGYGGQIPRADRWAIVAYVKALQRSQHARPEDVPASERADLPVVNLVPEEGANQP